MNEVPLHPGLAQGPIYLDYNGTTPIDPRVVDAMLPYLTTYFGNPSSAHFYARAPHTAIETKLYAPKGIGALYVRRGVQLEPVIAGGGQERGLRAGTENVAAIVALGTACEIARRSLSAEQEHLAALRDLLAQRLAEALPGRVWLNGHPTERLPNTLHVSLEGVIGAEVLAATPEIAAATGSACHAGKTEPSAVLLAMGMEHSRALGALRLTLGRWSTSSEVEQAAHFLAQTVRTMLSVVSAGKDGER